MSDEPSIGRRPERGSVLARWLCALALAAAAALLLGIGLRAALGGSAGIGFLLVLVAANVLVRLWWPRGGR